MTHLVDASLARDGNLNGVDPARMPQAKPAFRSAARLGMEADAAHATHLEKDATPPPAACWSGTMTTCGSPVTRGFRSTIVPRSRVVGADPAAWGGFHGD